MNAIATYLIAGGAVCGAVSLAAVIGYIIGRTGLLDERDTPRRAGRHIRWEHREQARADVAETLAAGNDRLVQAGLLADVPAWVTNPTQPYRHVNDRRA